MKEFRFAIMGAGKIANHFCDAVKRVEGCRVTAVASKSMERAERFAAANGVSAKYDSYEQMLVQEKPDCVYIAVTPHDHYRLGMLCLEHRVPVLCEKAMFLNSGEADAFFLRARELGVFAMEAMWSRFLPALNTARGWLRDGRIGEPVMADSGIGFVAPADPQDRYMNRALGGGAAYDITVYGYELLTWMLEREVERLHVEAVRGETGVDLTEYLLLRFAGNLPAMVRCSFATNMGAEGKLVIYGTKGRIVVPNPHVAMEAQLYLNGSDEPAERFSDEATENGFVYEIAETIRCVREGRVESDVVPHRTTCDCARVFDRIQEAIQY